jgi:spore coat protein SA
LKTVVVVGTELFPIPPIRGGAAELSVAEVSPHLKSWRPVIISRYDKDLPLHEVKGPVEYFRVPLEGWRKWLYGRYRQYFPFFERQIAKIIAKVQPDLVHVHNRPLLALALRNRFQVQLPIILHMHNPYSSLGKRERPPADTPIPVEGFLAISHFVMNRERDRLAKAAASHHVVYYGVNAEAFVSRWDHEDQARSLRRGYRLAQEPTVLFAGKLRESKGVHILVEAMERVWQVRPEAVLVLVGGTEFGKGRTGRVTEFLRQLQARLANPPGRVVFTGFIPPARMPQAYLLGDIFVGPSQFEEGLGMVFLEASASGLPIISTQQGGIPEVVQDGLTGLLLQRKDDSRELAAKILHLLDNPDLGQRLGRQGRQWVQENFTWEKSARALEQVYDEVLSLSGGRNK